MGCGFSSEFINLNYSKSDEFAVNISHLSTNHRRGLFLRRMEYPKLPDDSMPSCHYVGKPTLKVSSFKGI